MYTPTAAVYGLDMPEGAELRRSTDYLRKLLVGRRVVGVYAVGGRYAAVPPDGMAAFNWAEQDQQRDKGRNGRALIAQVDCKGKFMYWAFSSGWSLWCTYGMSGQWSSTRHPQHCAVELMHGHGDVLVLEDCVPGVYFNDPRHFGTLKFVHDPDGSKTLAKLATLGPDMLSAPPTLEQFVARMTKGTDKTIAEALLDQRRVSGIGNYVRAEALYLSELSPHRMCSSLTTDDWQRLLDQAHNVLRASYVTGGATISTYRNPDGSKGDAQRQFAVYGHRVDVLGNPVVREPASDGRTIWWAPAVQK